MGGSLLVGYVACVCVVCKVVRGGEVRRRDLYLDPQASSPNEHDSTPAPLPNPPYTKPPTIHFRTGGHEAIDPSRGPGILVRVVEQLLNARVEVDADPALLQVGQDGLVQVRVGGALSL